VRSPTLYKARVNESQRKPEHKLSYNGENKFVRKLIEEFGGTTVAFKDLPTEAQKAMAHYMAADGEAWETDDLRTCRRKYGRVRFGVVRVPRQVLETECVRNFLSASDKHNQTWETFEEYHQWYMEDSVVENHGDSVWPVILNCFPDEILQDGWHRFHHYVENRLETVPCLYYVG